MVDPAHEKRLVAPARWHLISVDGENQGADAVCGSEGRLICANKSERWKTGRLVMDVGRLFPQEPGTTKSSARL